MTVRMRRSCTQCTANSWLQLEDENVWSWKYGHTEITCDCPDKFTSYLNLMLYSIFFGIPSLIIWDGNLDFFISCGSLEFSVKYLFLKFVESGNHDSFTINFIDA